MIYSDRQVSYFVLYIRVFRKLRINEASNAKTAAPYCCSIRRDEKVETLRISHFTANRIHKPIVSLHMF